MVDIPNRIAKNGMIYFPDFCQLVLEQIREEGNGEEDFRMNMFKVTSGAFSFHSFLFHRAKYFCSLKILKKQVCLTSE